MSRKNIPLRMYKHAVSCIEDGEKMERSLEFSSNSSSLLQILGLEILLKCVIVVGGSDHPRHHKYTELWNMIGKKERDEILASARERIPGHANMDQLAACLPAWEHVFIKGRYPYEANAELTDAELIARAQKWVERGAPVSDADFAYYPYELESLIFGLKEFLKQNLDIKD